MAKAQPKSKPVKLKAVAATPTKRKKPTPPVPRAKLLAKLAKGEAALRNKKVKLPKPVKAVPVPNAAWPWPTAASKAAGIAVNKDVSAVPAVLDALIPGQVIVAHEAPSTADDHLANMEYEEFDFEELRLLTIFFRAGVPTVPFLKVGNSTAIANVTIDDMGYTMKTANGPSSNGDREVLAMEKVRIKKSELIYIRVLP